MDVMPNDVGPFPAPPAPTPNHAGSRRLPELIRSIGSDVSLLVRQQADLAKQEMKQKAGEKAFGGGLLLAAGILALFVVGFLGFAGAAALDLVLPAWAAFLIVALVYGIGGAIAALVGRQAVATPTAPEQTMKTVREDVEWAKRRLQR